MSIQSAHWRWVQCAAATQAAAAAVAVDAAIAPGQLRRVVAFHWIEWFEMISTSTARLACYLLLTCGNNSLDKLPTSCLVAPRLAPPRLVPFRFDLIWLICGNCRQSWQYAESVSRHAAFCNWPRRERAGRAGREVVLYIDHTQPHAVLWLFLGIARIKHENVP